MKKIIPILLIAALCLSSCGETYLGELNGSDYFFGEAVDIELPFLVLGHYSAHRHGNEGDYYAVHSETFFGCGCDTESLCEKLSDKNKDFEFTIINVNTIRVKYEKDGKQIFAFILLRRTPDEAANEYEDYRYCLFNFEGYVETGGEKHTFVFPYNLIDYRNEYDAYAAFEYGKKYKTAYTKSDFLDFYEQFGLLDISDSNDGFTINGVTNDEIRADGMALPITFTFYSDNGGNSFTISKTADETQKNNTSQNCTAPIYTDSIKSAYGKD